MFGLTRPRLAAALALVLVLTGAGVSACGDDDDDSAGGSTSAQSGGSADAEEIKVGAMLFGPKNDKSFNQAAYEGMVAATKEFPNMKLTAVLENRNTTQNGTDGVETLAPINDVVVGVSDHFGPIFDSTVDKFPKTYFINSAGYSAHQHKNLSSYAVDWGAAAYVAGVNAAKLTKSKVVGYVGGAEIPPTTQAATGFEAGVKSVDPSIKVLSNIIGDFSDVGKAKSATQAMITERADVIFPFLDDGIAGSYAAGTESGKNPALFKIVVPDCESYPNMVGTEVVNNTAATQRMLTDHAKGTLKPGTVFVGVKDPEMGTFALCPKYESNEEIAQATKETIDKINSGEIKLPEKAVNPRPSYPYREGFDGELVNP